MSRQAVSLFALLAAAPLAFVHPAQSQEVLLDEVVLSAGRLPQAAKRTGVSISVVTAEDLQKAGDQQLSSYLSRLPGVSVVQNGPPGTLTDVRIRGAEPRYVAVYIDGIRVDDPTQPQVQFDFGALTTADIGRIEVLRGSQSALWGGSAIGGVINITTRRAQEDGLRQTVALEAGSYGTLRGSYNLAWRAGRAETSVTLSHLHSDGFSAYDTVPRNPALEPDGTRQTRLSFNTRYQVSDSLTLGASAFIQRSLTDTDNFGSDNLLNNAARKEAGLRFFGEFEAGNTSHVLDVTHYRVRRDVVDTVWGNNSFDGTRTGFSYQGTTRFSDALSLVYGADTMQEKATYSIMPAGLSTRVSGIFAQGVFQPMQGLDISTSVRVDHNSRFGRQPSGRLALAWAATPELTLRAAASTGFRSPSIYEQFGDTNQNLIGNAALTPEKSRSLEIGADYLLANGASFGATLFRINTANAIGYQMCPMDPFWNCLPGTSNQYQNAAGTTRRQGFELAAQVPLAGRANLGLAWTYIDTRNPFGGRLARVPRNNLTLTLDGQLADRLDGQLAIRHVSGLIGGTASYTVVGAGLRYELAPDTQLSLRIENLFDEQYQTINGYGTAGRSFYVGLNKSF